MQAGIEPEPDTIRGWRHEIPLQNSRLTLPQGGTTRVVRGRFELRSTELGMNLEAEQGVDGFVWQQILHET